MAMSQAVSSLPYINLILNLVLPSGDLSDDLLGVLNDLITLNLISDDLDGASFDEDMDILALLVVELLFSLRV